MNKSENLERGSWMKALAADDAAIETKGNEVELYFKGDEAFAAMYEEIAKARCFVNLEMYMFLSDRVGREMAEALSKKAREGVMVRVVYDAIGSVEADEEIFDEMREAGVAVEVFRPVAPWRKRSGILGRNHRKNLIIDGRVAFTGGMNLSEVFSQELRGAKAWRDTHMRLEGPAAAACQYFFAETWSKVGGETMEVDCEFDIKERGRGESRCVIVGGRGFSQRRAIRRLYSGAFAEVDERVAMTVPYFVPPKRVLDVMRRRALEGMEVEVLVPRNSDVPFADWIREGLYPSLMNDGVRFREYTKSVLHAKSMLIDGRQAIVGSANFDYLSFSLNWELAVVIDDREVVACLTEQYHRDLEESEKVDWDWARSRPWWRRLFAWIGASLIRKI